MPTRSQVYAVVAIAAVVWTVLLLTQGVALQPSYLKPFSFAVTAVVVCFEVFDRWLWRWGPLPALTGRPVMRGTWKGVVNPMWVDPTTGEPTSARDAFLTVRQTYSTIAVTLLTAESRSTSLVASLDAKRGDGATAQWLFMNTPRLPLQGRSRVHHGAVMLEVHGAPPNRLTGCYWTDRDSKGELDFCIRSPVLHTDFQASSGDPRFLGAGIQTA